MLDLASAFGLADFYEQSVAKQQSNHVTSQPTLMDCRFVFEAKGKLF